MANFNKVLLLGNLTRDPQLSYLPRKPHPLWTEDTTIMWLNTNNACHLPTTVNNKTGSEIPFQISEDQKNLPEGVINKTKTVWRQNPALMYYAGTNRLNEYGEIYRD